MKTELSRYRLINTSNNETIRSVFLTEGECSILNYAYALNGTTLKYIK